MSFIRDTEIENTIHAYAAPLLKVAGIDEDAFTIHIVRSTVVNAFVSHGQQLFITTGLLRRTENAEQLMGVIAHELGHIAGGHLARMQGAVEDAGKTAMVTQLLGIAVGVLSGQPGAGAAVSSGSQHVVMRSLLGFSRSVEQSADRAGVTFLNRAGYSARGMLQFLKILEGQEFLQSDQQDAYVQTHPLTRDRIDFVQHHVDTSPLANRKVPERFEEMHARMVAKLDGFLDSPETTLQRYKASDRSIAARYARAIAYFRHADLDKAIPLIDGLIRERPKDPYFQELKGQLLFENGRLAPALAAYRKSVHLLPNAPLIRVSVAQVELEIGGDDLAKDALANLKEALKVDRSIPLAWHLAGTVYGRRGQMGLASWALAEYNLLTGRRREAAAFADRAMHLLKRGEPAWLRAQDIKQQTDRKG